MRLFSTNFLTTEWGQRLRARRSSSGKNACPATGFSSGSAQRTERLTSKRARLENQFEKACLLKNVNSLLRSFAEEKADNGRFVVGFASGRSRADLEGGSFAAGVRARRGG
jgi:hypothetical protein